jgi:hypothetical protein
MQFVSGDAALLDDVLQNPHGNGEAQPPAAPADPFAPRLAELGAQWAAMDKSDPPGDIGELAAALAADRAAITDLLASAANAQTINQLEARIAAFTDSRRKAVGDAAARASRTALTLELADIMLPAASDLSVEQKERLAKQCEPVTSLPAIPCVEMIAAAEAALRDRPALLAAIGEEIGRRKAGEKLKADADAIKAPPDGDMDVGQTDRLGKLRAPIAQLPLLPDAQQIGAAEAALRDLPDLIAAISGEINRTKAAMKLRADADAIKDPPDGDMDAAQKERLRKQREPITTLPPLPDPAQIAAAETALKDVPALVTAIQQEIARAAGLDLKAKAAAIADPPSGETDAAQKDRLLKQREPIVSLLDVPDGTKLQEARAALTALPLLVKAIEDEIVERKRLSGEKDKVLKLLAKTIDPPGIKQAESEALELLRKAVRDALKPSAGTTQIEQANIDAANQELKKVTDRIAELKQIAAARTVTLASIDKARGELGSAIRAVPDATATMLTAQLKAITDGENIATKIADYTALDALLTTFSATAAEATAFGNRQRTLMAQQMICVANGADPAALKAAMDAADVAAAKADFVTANASLHTFELVPMTGGAPSGSVKLFSDAVKAFRASPATSKMGPIKGLIPKFLGLEDFKTSFEVIVANVTVAKTVTPTDGIGRLTALKAKIDAFIPVFDAYEQLRKAFNTNPTSPAKTALKNKADWSNDPAVALPAITAALGTLPAVPPEDPNKVAFDKKKNALQQKVTQVTKNPAAAGSAHLTAAHTTALALAAPPALNYVGATAALEALLPTIATIIDYRKQRAVFLGAAANLDPSVSTNIMVTAQAAGAANNWPAAVAAMPQAIARAQAADEYYTRRAAVATARTATKDAAQQKIIGDALAAADALAASPNFKFAEATDELEVLRHTEGVSDVERDASAYTKALKQAETACTGMTAAFTAAGADAAGTVAVLKALQDARALFDPGGKPADAVAALAPVIANATKAARAAKEREAGVFAKKALDAAPPPPATPPPATPLSTAIAALAAALAAANAAAAAELVKGDSELAKGNFDPALAAYKAYGGHLKAAAKEAAKVLDLQDDGHSINAHGPGATHSFIDDTDPQVIRVKTGKRPDGESNASKFGSTFESEVDWVAARQMGLEKVQAAFATAAPLVPLHKQRIPVIIEHGRPIDRCIAGRRDNMSMESGELEEAPTCSTYEVWTGLTRTNSGFEFLKPTAAPGTWRLAWQYPHGDGWDNDKKMYTEPVPPFSLTP